jgi:hypothetical protein
MASRTVRAWRIAGLAGTCLAVLLGTTSLWSYASELAADRETQRETYDHPVTRVEIDLDAGAIRLAAGPSGQVVVERRLEWSGGKPTIEETWAGDTLRIRSRCGEATGGREHCSVGYTVRVPAGGVVVASRIEARGLTGNLRLTGSSGVVRLTDTTGQVRVRTGSGAVTATGLRAGPVEIQTSAGDVDLRFAAAPENLTATTGVGDVDIAVPGTDAYRVTVESSSGDHEVSVRQDSSAPHTIAVRTTRGDVKIGYSS